VAELFASRRRPRARFAGTFTSNFGTLTFQPEDPSGAVRGSYTHKGGRLQGELDGLTLRGRWSEPEHSKEGTFELTLDESGNSFSGSWKYAASSAWDGKWTGVRLALLPEAEGGNPGGWNSHTEGPLLAGPMVGEVSCSDARIWVQGRDTSELNISVFAPGGEEIRASLTPEWSNYLCAVFRVEGLRPDERYEYEISSENGLTERFAFKTAPPAGARRAKIAFGSCFLQYWDHNLSVFDAIGREGPDVFAMIGDNSYCFEPDWQSEHTIMLTHLRHRNNNALRRLISSVPTLGIWDDHDFGPGDAGGSYAIKADSLRAFQRCWAQASFGLPDTPGVFSSVRVGPAEIFLPDSRYYKHLHGPEILGKAQLNWLLSSLQASDAPIKIIASPTQVLPEHPVRNGWDCFRRDAPGELEAILSFIEENDIQGVVFLSGDLHMANLIHVGGRERDGKIGPELWELTSSALANDPWKEPQMGTDVSLVREVADQTNFGVVDIDLDRVDREIALVLRDQRGNTFFEQFIPLADLRVREAGVA
jgi:alkaline phosphatase D